MSRPLAVAGVLLLLVLAGCGGDDDDNGGGSDGADEATTEETTTAPGPDAQIAEPITIPPPRVASLDDAARRAGCELENPKDEGNQHVETQVDYDSNPPTSGPHNPFPAEDGVYPDAPATEELVHSLEHGRIVIQFDQNLDEAGKGGLQALFDEDPEHMLLTPNATDMPYEVAATAWGHLIGCPETNDRVYDALRAFRERYRDKGPERVP